MAWAMPVATVGSDAPLTTTTTTMWLQQLQLPLSGHAARRLMILPSRRGQINAETRCESDAGQSDSRLRTCRRPLSSAEAA